MQITQELYAALKSKVMDDVWRNMQVYEISRLDHYLHQEGYASKEAMIDWLITVELYGINLHPGAGFTIVN